MVMTGTSRQQAPRGSHLAAVFPSHHKMAVCPQDGGVTPLRGHPGSPRQLCQAANGSHPCPSGIRGRYGDRKYVRSAKESVG